MQFSATDIRSLPLPTQASEPSRDRLAFGAALLCVLLFLAVLAFARTTLPPLPSFVPIYASAPVIFNLVTAHLLFGQFVVLRSWASCALACGYAFAAVTGGVHALALVGAFAPVGPLVTGTRGSAWLWVFWQGGLPLFVIAYALLDRMGGSRATPLDAPSSGNRTCSILIGGVAILAAVCVPAWLAMSNALPLPVLVAGDAFTTEFVRFVIGALLAATALGALLWKRRGTVLDHWLVVVVAAWFFDLALSQIVSGARFDLGWYAGRLYGLLAAAALTFYLLIESIKHRVGLIRTSLAPRRTSARFEQRATSRRSELAPVRDAAEAADRAKSALLATMSHEIHTPMNGAISMAEVLFDRQLPEHLGHAVATIRTSTFALPELVEGVCTTLLPMATAKDVELSPFISPRVPARIWSDPTRLRLVLFNLVRNAITSSTGRDRRRRVAIFIDVSAEPSPNLILRVSDNGMGLDPAVLACMFEPFTQAEILTTRRFGSTGLGLTIVKRLATLMHGRIDVQSAPGEGSTFTVTLPLEPTVKGASPRSFDLAGVECVIVGRGTRIDDMRVYLEYAGARVQPAADTAAAIRLASALDSPVVIQASWRNTQSPALLRAAYEPVPAVRHVLIARAPQRSLQDAPGVTVVDGNCLRRAELVNAVAVASGRAATFDQRQSDDMRRVKDSTAALSIDEARRLGRLILIAEDDEVNQLMIHQQIQTLGYAAVIVNNGAKAYKAWREGRYSLLLTDLNMPEMDGYSLAAAIRRHETNSPAPEKAHLPILALTSNARDDSEIHARAAGMDDYLTKPIRLRSLKVALRKWLPLDGPNAMQTEMQKEF